MDHIILTSGKFEKEARKTLPEARFLVYNPEDFHEVLGKLKQENADRVTVITEYTPLLAERIKNCVEEADDVIRFEPEPFSHPYCLFTGLLFTVMLHMYTIPYIPSTYSYATCFKKEILNSTEFRDLLAGSYSPVAFSISSFLLALKKGYNVKHIMLKQHEGGEIKYESLKHEFINATSVFLKILEKYQPRIHNMESIRLEKGSDVFEIPGKRFLRKEFVAGFKKYAPFWKRHLYEDHFAILSSIYTGREEKSIDDRMWIRILFDMIKASLEYDDKTKISRSLFPIYALYLEGVHSKPVKEHMEKYMKILREESFLFRDLLEN